MKDDALDRLPRWARERITTLERRVTELNDLVGEEARGNSKTAFSETWEGRTEKLIPLKDDKVCFFFKRGSTEAGEPDGVQVEFRVFVRQEHDGPVLDVNLVQGGRIDIEARASNSVHLRARR